MLEELRRELEEIDREILALISRRAEVALRIGRVKAQNGIPLYLPQREEEVIAQVVRANPGPLGPKAVERIFRRIVAETRRLEEEVVRDDRGDAPRGNTGTD